MDVYVRGHLDEFSMPQHEVGIRIHAEKVQLLAPIPGTDFMLAWDLLGSPTFTTAADTFYYVYVELVGQTLTVYRGATPETMERVLEASEQIPAPVPTGLEATYGQFAADVSGLDGWYCLDDVAVIEDPAASRVDAEYVYDALGRRIEKRVNGEFVIERSRYSRLSSLTLHSSNQPSSKFMLDSHRRSFHTPHIG